MFHIFGEVSTRLPSLGGKQAAREAVAFHCITSDFGTLHPERKSEEIGRLGCDYRICLSGCGDHVADDECYESEIETVMRTQRFERGKRTHRHGSEEGGAVITAGAGVANHSRQESLGLCFSGHP
jgi:hypothetical protein